MTQRERPRRMLNGPLTRGLPLLVVLVLLGPPAVLAQGAGEFQTAPGGARALCTDITAPVALRTWCRDHSRGTLNVYEGTGYQSADAIAGGFVNVKDPRFGARGDATTVTTAAITTGTTALSAAGAGFVAADAGKGEFGASNVALALKGTLGTDAFEAVLSAPRLVLEGDKTSGETVSAELKLQGAERAGVGASIRRARAGVWTRVDGALGPVGVTSVGIP